MLLSVINNAKIALECMPSQIFFQSLSIANTSSTLKIDFTVRFSVVT